MKHATDQRLIGNAFLLGTGANGLEVSAGETDIDPLVFQARCLRCFLELAEKSRRGHTAQFTGLEISEELLLCRLQFR